MRPTTHDLVSLQRRKTNTEPRASIGLPAGFRTLTVNEITASHLPSHLSSLPLLPSLSLSLPHRRCHCLNRRRQPVCRCRCCHRCRCLCLSLSRSLLLSSMLTSLSLSLSLLPSLSLSPLSSLSLLPSVCCHRCHCHWHCRCNCFRTNNNACSESGSVGTPG